MEKVPKKLILISIAAPVVVYFFQASLLFSLVNSKCWTILAGIYALFGVLLQAQNCAGVPKFTNMRCDKKIPSLGTGGGTKMIEFSAKFQGGGVIFNQKIKSIW